MQFQIGGVMRLKSGPGPEMTIRKITEENEVICEWFNRLDNNNYSVGEHYFKAEQFIKVVRS